MVRTFIEVPSFTKKWYELGFSDDDLLELQDVLLDKPDYGVVVQGTGGLRKLRYAFRNRGKSGSVRICYVDFAIFEKIYLIQVYTKKEKDNLSNSEKVWIKKYLKILKEEAGGHCNE